MNDQEKFFQAIYQYRRECMKYLKRKTGCTEEEASDVFIEACLDLFKRKEIKLEELENVVSYLNATCFNHWKRYFYQNKAIKGREDKVKRYFYQELKRPDLLHSFDEEDELYFIEKQISRVYEVLNTIGERCKNLITYFYLKQMGLSEISELLGFSTTQVATITKFRCMQKLRDKVLKSLNAR